MKKEKVLQMIGCALAATLGAIIPTVIRIYYTPGGMLPWQYVIFKEAVLVFFVFIVAYAFGAKSDSE
ncbi:MAG: hypothetical protein IKE91_01060 [Clostridia bacterium]|nr:hypothetical protein [Clostridia bacterium]